MVSFLGQQTAVIAHRGSSAYEKENTLKSFKRAIEHNADFIEFDVRRTRDNVLVVFHNGFIQGKPLRSLSYDQLLVITLKRGYFVPTLSDVLSMTAGKIKLDIELKEAGYEEQVIDQVSQYITPEQFFISSFKDKCLARIKQLDSRITTGLLIKEDRFHTIALTRASVEFLKKRLDKNHADFILPSSILVRFGFLNRANQLERPMIVWTINDIDMMSDLIESPAVRGIITDKPDHAVAIRQVQSYLSEQYDDRI